MRLAVTAVLLLAATGLASAETPKPKPKPKGPGAIVFVIDTSGSMQGAKLEAVRAALIAAIDALDPKDEVAVVTFDSEAGLVILPQPAANKVQIKKDLARIRAGGGTNFYPGLKVAYDTLIVSALKKRHAILFSDGEAPSAGLEDHLKLMRAEHITLSTVGVTGADRTLLARLAELGEGRLYMVDDMKTLPKLFIAETKLALH